MKRIKEQERSYAGIIVVSVLFFIIGVGVSAVELALKPVPDGPMPPGRLKDEIAYTRGTTEGGAGWDARAKKVWHGVPGSYLFTEADLNHLVGKHIDNSVAIEGLESVHVEELPNVRLLPDDRAQVGVILSMPEYFGAHRFVYQVKGRVVKGGFAQMTASRAGLVTDGET